nr:plasmid pRiA4b ORF-3 family protein [Bacillus sp. B15-48]
MEKAENNVSLVTLLSPLFSKEQLTTTLKRQRPVFKEGAYLFKVKLSSSCWRILQFSSSHTLLDLHNLIQKAFDFDDDHLYAFYMDGIKFSKHFYNAPMDTHGPYVNEVKIGDLDLYEGQSFLYLFDFGYEWEFNINLLKISGEEDVGAPKIKEKLGEAPDQYRW